MTHYIYLVKYINHISNMCHRGKEGRQNYWARNVKMRLETRDLWHILKCGKAAQTLFEDNMSFEDKQDKSFHAAYRQMTISGIEAT